MVHICCIIGGNYDFVDHRIGLLLNRTATLRPFGSVWFICGDVFGLRFAFVIVLIASALFVIATPLVLQRLTIY